ncbi:ROK family transcriptional regulator [Yoonia vestfoldensis]|uniref:ROK family transcriptional regulator n=1 Tax=Yoonia vestfoldensis TaxID=245188 RepID=UPI00036757B9|nr:ROK family transcriptional regulator [Yoonia vestfoldensis]
MDDALVRSLSTGLSQKGVRDHNERLLLSLLQRHGSLPAPDLARLSSLSPPTISAILRKLESDGLLQRGKPLRGKVGKPSVPMMLAPDGVFAIGIKIGRRSADFLLTDFTGGIRLHRQLTYAHPLPREVFAFVQDGLAAAAAELPERDLARICGIGIAAPFDLWNWHDLTGPPAAEFQSWKDVDFARELARFTDLPVSVINDATAACQAEHLYGRGKQFRDYAYFFVGAFVGGGIVLNNSVYEGRQGNAGALGSLRSIGPNGESRQLVDRASIHTLETRLRNAGHNPIVLWQDPASWADLADLVAPWLDQTGQELAKASLSTCAVIDFEAIVIDGAFPPFIRSSLVDKVRSAIQCEDTRGLILPVIESGSIGNDARALGAACSPILAQFLLNSN